MSNVAAKGVQDKWQQASIVRNSAEEGGGISGQLVERCIINLNNTLILLDRSKIVDF